MKVQAIKMMVHVMWNEDACNRNGGACNIK